MILHIVLEGETLDSIAALYGVSVNDLIAINDLSGQNALAVGQALLVPRAGETYTVSPGDTLLSVSQRTGQSMRELLRKNPFVAVRVQNGQTPLYEGETLLLSYDGQGNAPLRASGYAYPFITQENLEDALLYLSDLVVFTYGFDENGSLIPPQTPVAPVVSRAREEGVFPVLLLSTLGRDGRFNNELSSALFSSAQAQSRLFSQLLETIGSEGFEAIEVDFEYVKPEEKEAYAGFIRDLTNFFAPYGIEVMVALAPKTFADQPGLLYEGHDYAALGEAASAVLLMTYEWGYTYGPPQAVAPIDKVRAVVDFAREQIPAGKIFLGIPNYGYDWTLPYVPGSAARSLGPAQAAELAAQTGAEILFDESSASPYFRYTDQEGREHVVWFEDARSFRSKLDLIAEKELAGFGVWTVMRPATVLFALADASFDLLS